MHAEKHSAPSYASPLPLWLVAPVKPFGEGKSRLAGTLNARQRGELSREWLAHVLAQAQAFGRFDGMVVVSRDGAVLDVAREYGAIPLYELGAGLNPALEQARRYVMQTMAGQGALLVLPSDLPLLSVTDLVELYDLALEGDGMVIAPSRDGGTNALLLRPPQAIPFRFGEESFAHHVAAAASAGLPCRVYQSATLALDVDRPEDLLPAHKLPVEP